MMKAPRPSFPGDPRAPDADDEVPARVRTRSPRALLWSVFFIFSLIAVGSVYEAVRYQRFYSHSSSEQTWAVGSSTAVFLLAFAAVTVQMIPAVNSGLLGSKLELVAIVGNLAFSSVSVGCATNPASGMAINSSGGISFGNLYYSTWACEVIGVMLLASYLRTERGFDINSELHARGRRFRHWVILALTSLVVMGSAASSHDAKCFDRDVKPEPYCGRASYGVSAGCIGCVASLSIVAARMTCVKREGGEDGPNRAMFTAEAVLGTVLLLVNCMAVAYLTSEEGPGAPIGNLFYASWLSLGFAAAAITSCLQEWQTAGAMVRVESIDAPSRIGEDSLSSSNIGPPPGTFSDGAEGISTQSQLDRMNNELGGSAKNSVEPPSVFTQPSPIGEVRISDPLANE